MIILHRWLKNTDKIYSHSLTLISALISLPFFTQPPPPKEPPSPRVQFLAHFAIPQATNQSVSICSYFLVYYHFLHVCLCVCVCMHMNNEYVKPILCQGYKILKQNWKNKGVVWVMFWDEKNDKGIVYMINLHRAF